MFNCAVVYSTSTWSNADKTKAIKTHEYLFFYCSVHNFYVTQNLELIHQSHQQALQSANL